MCDTDMVLHSIERYENFTMSSFGGYTDEISHENVKRRVHTVGLEFKYVLNFILLVDFTYVGYYNPPILAVNFA